MVGLRVYGVRHHGPGSARALARALAAQDPDHVVIEGPPEATAALASAADPALVPPVALSVRRKDEPTRGLVVPFAAWSPEWVAIRWALDRGATVVFADRATAARLADPTSVAPDDEAALWQLADLGGAADIADWWDRHVEEVDGGPEIFDAVLDVMREARDGRPTEPATERREAALRLAARAARRVAERGVAVVCGAWHAPAVLREVPVGVDKAALAADDRAKMEVAWVPWSHRRLAADAYAAAQAAPGWAQCCFDAGLDAPVTYATRWVTAARAAGAEVGAAPTLDLIGIARGLATLRGRPRPSRVDLDDAAEAVLGSSLAARIGDAVRVDDRLGSVPEPERTPLFRDVERALREVRLSRDAGHVEIDLRDEIGARRSVVLHRLCALGLPFATEVEASSQGTFRERWRLAWSLDCDAVLAARSPWGDRVEAVAEGRLVDQARLDGRMDERCDALDRALRADLPVAADVLAGSLLKTAARGRDTVDLFRASVRVGRAARFGAAARVGADLVAVARALFDRGRLTLPEAARRLDDGAAAALIPGLVAATEAIGLIGAPDAHEAWSTLLGAMAVDQAVHPRLRGFVVRAGLDRDVAPAIERWWFECSAPDPADTAAWLEGLLSGGDAGLLYDLTLQQALDLWLTGLSSDGFDRAMPALRRAFATVDPDVKRRLVAPAPAVPDRRWNAARADSVLPALVELIGADALAMAAPTR
jgi:hypothetical protein